MEFFAGFRSLDFNGYTLSCRKAGVVACFGVERSHDLFLGFSCDIKPENVSCLNRVESGVMILEGKAEFLQKVDIFRV